MPSRLVSAALLVLVFVVLAAASLSAPVAYAGDVAYVCNNATIQTGSVLTTLEAINAGTYTSALDKCGTCPAQPTTGKQPCELLEVQNVKVVSAQFIVADGDWRLYLTDGTAAKGGSYSFRIEIPTAYQQLFKNTYGCEYPPLGATITLDGYPYFDSGIDHGNPLSHWELHPPTSWIRTDAAGGHC
jgi:hypothetical protein